MPQSARLSEGGGVQSLFGQCPNRPDLFQTGASLRPCCYNNGLEPNFGARNSCFLCSIQTMPDEDDNGTDNDLVMMTTMVEIPCALAQAARQRIRRLPVSRGGVILSKIVIINFHQ